MRHTFIRLLIGALPLLVGTLMPHARAWADPVTEHHVTVTVVQEVGGPRHLELHHDSEQAFSAGRIAQVVGERAGQPDIVVELTEQPLLLPDVFLALGDVDLSQADALRLVLATPIELASAEGMVTVCQLTIPSDPVIRALAENGGFRPVIILGDPENDDCVVDDGTGEQLVAGG